MKGTVYCVLLSMVLTGCSKFQTPITKRDQLMLLSKEDEIEVSKAEFHRIMRKSQLCKEMEKCEMVNNVGKRLVSNLKGHHIQKWKFVLIENDSVNATCLPNGTVVVNSGVFKVAKNEDQLATILSHEIAHALSRHGNARISRSKVINGVEIAGGIITALLNPFLVVPYVIAYEAGTRNGIELPLSRLEEQEADIIGLNLMYKAGYNLDESLNFWNNLIEVNGHRRHIKSTTHMSYAKRLKRIKKHIGELKSLKS